MHCEKSYFGFFSFFLFFFFFNCEFDEGEPQSNNTSGLPAVQLFILLPREKVGVLWCSSKCE